MTVGFVPSYRVLGVRVNAVEMAETVNLVTNWALLRDQTRWVAVADMHVVSEAQRDREYRAALESADLCVADGTPLMLMGRIAGFPMRRRVYGPDLMLAVLERTAGTGIRHFFYGGVEGVADELASRMRLRYPGLLITGTHSPPFGPIPPCEDPAVLEKIRACRPNIVWVGLGAPKQEHWMQRRRLVLGVPLMVGVGAAFDFHSGRVTQAPTWMKENGLEWLYRLKTEPRRLWRRYLVGGSEFALRLLVAISTGEFRIRKPILERTGTS